jgi:hypothetical protein
MRRFVAIALLPALTLATTHNPTLPPEVTGYRAAQIRNGCFVEAVVFADFYMHGEFDGPRSWAQAVFIEGKLQGRTFGHAVALLQTQARTWLWDAEWGLLPIDLAQARKCGTLTRLAEVTYQNWLADAAGQTAQGHPPAPRPVLPRPADMSELDWAASRLGAHRPTLRARFLAGDRRLEALGFVVNDRIFIYSPESGTIGMSIGGGGAKAALQALLQKAFGPVTGVEFSQIRVPAGRLLPSARPR